MTNARSDKSARGMRKNGPRAWQILAAGSVALLGFSLSTTAASATANRTGFGFNAGAIAGFPTGAVSLTGGGAFDLAAGFAHSAGGFRCTSSVNQGPLTGCATGEGVRWDTAALLPSAPFKCTGSAREVLKNASTGEDTVALQADFYRAGDGNNESFKAQMIVSAHDLAPDVEGLQNVWVQGVGCGSATVHFSR